MNDEHNELDDNLFSDDSGSRRRRPRFERNRGFSSFSPKLIIGIVIVVLLIAGGFAGYQSIKIDVPAMHYAVLVKKTGLDIDNGQEIAPSEEYKGLQKTVLTEGRYFYNPYDWSWEIYPMIEIPRDKMGVRTRLYGDDLGYGNFLATSDGHKSIVEEVLRPGRYPINAKVIDRETRQEVGVSRSEARDYIELIELWEPKVIPAGYKGIVTNLAGPLPEDPNVLLVEKGHRGPQQETLEPGTYYMNPYMYRINAIDTRSQRFNLAEGKDMSFPSKDGFPISLDGIIEFRVMPETAARTFVLYNDESNDTGRASKVDEEIVAKVMMPNARAFCRLRGSNSSAREFIGGVTRTAFQAEFQQAITETCRAQGIEIVQALITKIKPPQAIATPLRAREVAAQQLGQYTQQVLQQQQEAKLATEKSLIEQRKELIGADREIVAVVTKASQEQLVALEEANRDMEVAERRLQAAKDEAEAIMSRAAAKAAIIGFENEAVAAGWKKSVEALGNDGEQLARYVLYQKLAPGYRSIMTNTADSPLMDIFKIFAANPVKSKSPEAAEGK